MWSGTSSKQYLVEAVPHRSGNSSTINKLVSIVDEMPCVISLTIHNLVDYKKAIETSIPNLVSDSL
jgi:hypothetical protein